MPPPVGRRPPSFSAECRAAADASFGFPNRLASWAVSFQFRFQRRDQIALLVDGTLAIEVVIVFGHGQQALGWNVPSAEHVFEEGNYFCLRFRPTESNHQNGIVVHTPSRVEIQDAKADAGNDLLGRVP